MKKKYTAVLWIAAALVLGGCAKENADSKQESVQAEQESEKAEQENTDTAKTSAEVSENALFGVFETVTLDNEAVDQSIFEQADLTMVNIWATYCQPCISEMPDLGKLSDEYAEKGVQIIGIVSDVSSLPNLEAGAIVDYTGADYLHLLPSRSMITNYLSEVQVVPTTVFVNSKGEQVGDVYTGSKSKETWAEIIDSLLEELG